jgi:hypothetical protein
VYVQPLDPHFDLPGALCYSDLLVVRKLFSCSRSLSLSLSLSPRISNLSPPHPPRTASPFLYPAIEEPIYSSILSTSRSCCQYLGKYVRGSEVDFTRGLVCFGATSRGFTYVHYLQECELRLPCAYLDRKMPRAWLKAKKREAAPEREERSRSARPGEE